MLKIQLIRVGQVLTLLCFIAIDSSACSCIGKNSVQQEFYRSDAVFIGETLSKTEMTISSDSLPSGYTLTRIQYRILVSKKYKGDAINDTVLVVTGAGKGDCGYNFKENEKYIIYAEYSEKYFPAGENVVKFLYTDNCTRTVLKNIKEQRKLKRCMRRLKASKTKIKEPLT